MSFFQTWNNLSRSDNLQPSDPRHSSISIHETRASLTLNIPIADLKFAAFDVQATERTVFIWGQWLEIAEIQGCCCPLPFEQWIPLAIAVYPETLWMKADRHYLSIQLAKQINANPLVA